MRQIQRWLVVSYSGNTQLLQRYPHLERDEVAFPLFINLPARLNIGPSLYLDMPDIEAGEVDISAGYPMDGSSSF